MLLAKESTNFMVVRITAIHLFVFCLSMAKANKKMDFLFLP